MGASQSGCGSSPYEVDTRVATGPIFDSILNVPETRKDTLRAAEAVEKLLCKDATALQANIFVRQFVSEWLTSRSTRARPGKTTMEIVNVATLIEFVAICLGFGHADANCEAKLSIEDVFFHMFAEKESPEVLFSEFLELLCDITAAPPPAHDAIKQAHETALQTNKAKRSGPKPFCEFVASWLREALPFALPTMQNWMECQLLGPNQYIGGICETDSEAARLPPHVAQFFQKWSTVTIFSQRRMVPALGLWSTIQLRVSAEQLPTTPSSVLFRYASPTLLCSILGPEFSEHSWRLLYNSGDHGMSSSAIQRTCFKYNAATVAVFRDAAGCVFGVGLDREWQDSHTLFGGDQCRVFELHPELRQVQGCGVRVLYNTRSRNADKGFGAGVAGKWKFWMQSDLTTGTRMFGPGSVPGVSQALTVHAIEIWGCGGDKAAESQRSRQAVGHQIQQRAARAKRPDWNTDRDLLVMAGTNAGRDIAAGEAGRLEHDAADS
eukprot:m.529574 g.529574  ORF g.529574 m.529574 type:complete len:494 (-) comp22019_c0_seq8:387-1868(-)